MKLNREALENIIKEVEAGHKYTVNENLLRKSTINKFRKAYIVEPHKSDSSFITISKPICPVLPRRLQQY